MTSSPTSHFFRSRRLKLHYADWGNDKAPTLILLHGGRDHGRSWDWVARALNDRFHIVAPDLAGHGESEWNNGGDYPFHDFIYDLSLLIDHLSVRRVSIVGHSFGGNIGLRFSGLYRETVEKLVAIEGMGQFRNVRAEQPVTDRLEAWVSELRAVEGRQTRRYGSLDAAHARMLEENPHLSPEQAQHLTLHGARANDDGTVSWKFDPHFRVWPPVDHTRLEIETLWQRIACPVLLITGAESGRVDPRGDGRLKLFKIATAITIEDAGHWVHHDRLDAFVEAVREFLASERP